MIPNINTLPPELTLKVASFLSAEDVVSLADVIPDSARLLFKDKCRGVFGKTDITEKPDADIDILRFLCRYAEAPPNIAVNHNVFYRRPNNFFEKFKWIVGAENDLDKEVQHQYDRVIKYLEQFKATTIHQLQSQMRYFWHCDREVKDFAQFKFNEKTRMKSGLIGFFLKYLDLGSLLRPYYGPANPQVGEKLESRCRKTCAEIGAFTLENKQYTVAAFLLLGDERSARKGMTYRDDTHLNFHGIENRVHIGIFETGSPYSYESLEDYGRNACFAATIARPMVDPISGEILKDRMSSEGNTFHSTQPVSNCERHIEIDSHICYPGGEKTKDPQGSDMPLSQKMTQIIVEMLKQNESISSVYLTSYCDDLPVLMCGGFEADYAFEPLSGEIPDVQRVMERVKQFRSNKDNKLFPPFKNYGTYNMTFKPENLTKENVSYSKGGVLESWSQIIKKNPILKEKAAVLPEYLATPPMFKLDEQLKSLR